MLEGLLVDLVPFGDEYFKQNPRWANSEAFFWASVGDRIFATAAGAERHRQEMRERRERNPGGRIMFGIQTKPDAPEPCKPLGDMAFNWIVPHHRIAALGAMIGEPDYWGGGYGTDALLLIVDFGFEWLDMRKLWLGTMSLNARVMRQMEKVGFKLEVRQREAYWADGKPADALLYGLLREEWPGRAAKIDELGLRAK